MVATDYQIFQESEQLINIVTLILPVHVSKAAKLLNPHNLDPLLIPKQVPNSLPLDRKPTKLHLIILRIAMDNLDIIPLADEQNFILGELSHIEDFCLAGLFLLLRLDLG